jgi:hypothetical protein
MQEPQLFLGVLVDSLISTLLQGIDPKKKALFIRENDSSCLECLSHQDHAYLGKWAGSIRSLEELLLLEENIRSLLRKLLPELNNKPELQLFPVYHLKRE